MPVFLRIDRLVLQGFVEAGVIEHLFDLHNDPDVMRFIDGGKARSPEEIEREYRETLAGDGSWAATEKETGGFLGWNSLRSPEGCGPGDVELGYRLKRSVWGRGYATEGSRTLIHKGFAEFGVRHVWAQTMAVNLASRRVMERAGLAYGRFTWSGTSRCRGRSAVR